MYALCWPVVKLPKTGRASEVPTRPGGDFRALVGGFRFRCPERFRGLGGIGSDVIEE